MFLSRRQRCDLRRAFDRSAQKQTARSQSAVGTSPMRRARRPSPQAPTGILTATRLLPWLIHCSKRPSSLALPPSSLCSLVMLSKVRVRVIAPTPPHVTHNNNLAGAVWLVNKTLALLHTPHRCFLTSEPFCFREVTSDLEAFNAEMASKLKAPVFPAIGKLLFKFMNDWSRRDELAFSHGREPRFCAGQLLPAQHHNDDDRLTVGVRYAECRMGSMFRQYYLTFDTH